MTHGWNLQGAHNASKLNNVIHNDSISVSPPRPVSQPLPVGQQTRSQAASVQQNVPVKHQDSRRRAAAQYVELEKEANIGNISGELNIAGKSVRERTGGGDDTHCMYVKWHQETCYIGSERKCVCYDELTHPEWVSGLISITSEEPNSQVQANICKYLASLNQDVCDCGFEPSKRVHSLILSYIE